MLPLLRRATPIRLALKAYLVASLPEMDPRQGRHQCARAQLLGWAPIVSYWIAMASIPQLRSAVEIGGDEGYELMKAFLHNAGYELYAEIWNNQPPMHTLIVSALFRVVGPSAYAARLVSVFFSGLLLWALFRCVRTTSTANAAALACGFLVLSDSFLPLSASVMLEIPALSLGMCGTLAGLTYARNRSTRWLVLSGVAFGAALQTKLSAVIFIPIVVTQIVLTSWRSGRLKQAVAPLFLWGSSVVTISIMTLAVQSPDAISMLFTSNFSSSIRAGLGDLEDIKPLYTVFVRDPDIFVLAVAGICLLTVARNAQILFPVLMLVTTIVAHYVHTPFWPYFHLHFMISLSWLAALVVLELCQRVRRSWRSRNVVEAIWIGCCTALTALELVNRVPHKIERASDYFTKTVSVDDDRRVTELRKYASQTQWVYTDRVIYAFHAGLLVPPELAVVPAKRIVAEGLGDANIIAMLQRYEPEQVLLVSNPRASSSEWQTFLRKGYYRSSSVVPHHYLAAKVLPNHQTENKIQD
jgi:hypothetical protein